MISKALLMYVFMSVWFAGSELGPWAPSSFFEVSPVFSVACWLGPPVRSRCSASILFLSASISLSRARSMPVFSRGFVWCWSSRVSLLRGGEVLSGTLVRIACQIPSRIPPTQSDFFMDRGLVSNIGSRASACGRLVFGSAFDNIDDASPG